MSSMSPLDKMSRFSDARSSHCVPSIAQIALEIMLPSARSVPLSVSMASTLPGRSSDGETSSPHKVRDDALSSSPLLTKGPGRDESLLESMSPFPRSSVCSGGDGNKEHESEDKKDCWVSDDDGGGSGIGGNDDDDDNGGGGETDNGSVWWCSLSVVPLVSLALHAHDAIAGLSRSPSMRATQEMYGVPSSAIRLISTHRTIESRSRCL